MDGSGAEGKVEGARPIALVFTDMVGSTAAKRAASLGGTPARRDGAYLDTIQSRHLKLVRECVAIHGGREIMTIGDAFFLTFEDARAAILCCAEIQMRLKAAPIMMPTGRMQLRIGMHVGSPKYFEESWHGTDVDTAARTESAASADQIVVTEPARELILEMEGIVLRPLGTFPLKGLGNVQLWDADYDEHGPRPAAMLSLEEVRRQRRMGTLRRVGTWALLMAIGVGAWFGVRARRGRGITDKDSIVLADFENKTGDPVFDGALRQGMMVQLEQSPFLSLVSDQRVQGTLALMGRPADALLTPALGREICQRTGSAAVLDGSIASVGSEYVIGLRATDCRNGEVMDVEQVQAARKEDVLKALGETASRFRTRIGESLATVKEHNRPLEEATTSSLEALKAYSEGFKLATALGPLDGLPFYRRAVEIDPQFAIGYAMLGRTYGDMGEELPAAESTKKSYELRDRASDRERFFISASYDIVVTGNLERAQQTCEVWAQTYPRDANAFGLLSGGIYPAFGKYDRAIEAGQKTIAANPDASFGYANLAYAYQSAGRLAEAEQTLARAAARGVTRADLLILGYQAAWLGGKQGEMDRLAGLALKVPGAEDFMANQRAFAAAYAGRLEEARRLSRQAEDTAEAEKQPERAAQFKAGDAVREALFGNMGVARRVAGEALAISQVRDVQYGAALALALAGDTARAQGLTDDLAKRYPEDSTVIYSYLPTLRGLLAVKRGDGAKAIEGLRVAAPYELGAPPSSVFGFYGLLYPVYARGEAYLAMKDGVAAAGEFQRILDHRDVMVTDPVGVVARLELARAYAMAGDTGKAKAAYEGFFEAWKGADGGVPVLVAARGEYGRL